MPKIVTDSKEVRLKMLAFLLTYYKSLGGEQRHVIKAYEQFYGDTLTRGRIARTYATHGKNYGGFIKLHLPDMTTFFFGEEPESGMTKDEVLKVLDKILADNPVIEPKGKFTKKPPPDVLTTEVPISAPAVVEKPRVVVENVVPDRSLVPVELKRPKRPSDLPDELEALIAQAIVNSDHDENVFADALEALKTAGCTAFEEAIDVERYVKTPDGVEKFLKRNGYPEPLAMAIGREIRKATHGLPKPRDM